MNPLLPGPSCPARPPSGQASIFSSTHSQLVPIIACAIPGKLSWLLLILAGFWLESKKKHTKGEGGGGVGIQWRP